MYSRVLQILSVLLFRSTSLAQAQRSEMIPICMKGVLLDDNGDTVSGGKLQIWQTDTEGIYDHPRSMNIDAGLDPTFQYYGTATSGPNGEFSFLTIRPEHYPARPESHIHFKIFVSDELVLTTQMYFADENHPYPASLQLDLTPHPEGGFSTEKNITVNLGNGGPNPATPSQASGPYYPVVDFFDVGNNLILTDDSNIGASARTGLLSCVESSGSDQVEENDPVFTESEETATEVVDSTGQSSDLALNSSVSESAPSEFVESENDMPNATSSSSVTVSSEPLEPEPESSSVSETLSPNMTSSSSVAESSQEELVVSKPENPINMTSTSSNNLESNSVLVPASLEEDSLDSSSFSVGSSQVLTFILIQSSFLVLFGVFA